MNMVHWTVALDLIQDVRGSIAMYLFIIEESIQTVGMACYMLYKDQKYQEVMDLATWIISDIIDPAIEFNNTYGTVAYPLNMAYGVFYESAKRNMNTYLETCKAKAPKPQETFMLEVESGEEMGIPFKINGSLQTTPYKVPRGKGEVITIEIVEKKWDSFEYIRMMINDVPKITDKYTFTLATDTLVMLCYVQP